MNVLAYLSCIKALKTLFHVYLLSLLYWWSDISKPGLFLELFGTVGLDALFLILASAAFLNLSCSAFLFCSASRLRLMTLTSISSMTDAPEYSDIYYVRYYVRYYIMCV